MVDVWVLVPLVAISFTFGTVILLAKYVTEYRANVKRIQAEGGGEYKRLAEAAVANNQELLTHLRQMNETLGEIERVLKEV